MIRNSVTFLFLITLIFCKNCEKGEIMVNSNCISCQNIPNTVEDVSATSVVRQQCVCKLGFIWSSSKAQCLPIQIRKNSRISSALQTVSTNINSEQLTPRLLQTTTCNIAGGFIPYHMQYYQNSNPTVCYNCRLLPYGLAAGSSSTCGCQAGFVYYSPWTTCYCYSGSYIDPISGRCLACTSMGTQMAQCSSCSSPFKLTLQGCIYMPTMPKGGNGECVTGYVINYVSSACFCDYLNNYSVNSSGICVLCASSDSNCINCKNNYYYDGIQCLHGSLIPNYDYTISYACKTGYIAKKNLFSNQVISCACSFAAKYYQNGANCLSCSTSLPTGVALADCQACSPSAKFYKGSVECIYCPGVFLAVGTATINGCECPKNYFWNANTDKCECDFALGFIGGSIATCINCSSIANTDQVPLTSSCSCLPGFKWNSQTNTCDCDTTSPSVFTLNGVCVNCGTMPGATLSVAVGGTSCVCHTGFYWNPALKKCVCDTSQNFAISGGFCIDCRTTIMSNGLANAFGCVCINGFMWNSVIGQCACPSGSVIIGVKCVACSLASLQSDAVSADCLVCKNANGFASNSLGCFSCAFQSGASPVVTNGVCTCPVIGTVWRPNLGACACDWSQFYYTKFNTAGGYSCFQCTSLATNSSKCTCDSKYLFLDPVNNICTDASFDPNGSGSAANFTCKTGFFWSKSNLPYKCISGYAAFSGYYSSSGNSYISCTSSNNAAMCGLCDTASGYLFISATSQCLLCSTVTGSTAVATINSCVCNTGRSWNGITFTCDSITCSTGMTYNPSLKICLCDPVKSVLVGSNCVSCVSVTNSNGYAVSMTTCGCVSPNSWVASTSGGVCTTNICNAAQISIATGCFTCPSTKGGTGIVIGTGCGCTANYLWSATATGGSCTCNYSKAYLSGTACMACPAGTTGGDGNGKCLCTGTRIWNGASCLLCNTAPNAVLLSSGSCFVCGTTGTYTVSKVVSAANNSCTCTQSPLLSWNSNGYCDCGLSSVLIVNGSKITCFKCANASAFTSAKASTTSCSCVSSNLQWNPARLACDCTSVSNTIVVGSGSTAKCVTCTPSVYMVGASAGLTVCVCVGKLIWNSATNTCGCSNPLTMIISGNAASTLCITCSSILYGGTIASSTSCSCQGTGLVFNSSNGGSCSCPATSIILPNFTCSACPAGSTQYTAYECLCSPGYIWSSTQGCLQCGSSAIPNSISSGGTNFACVCSSGYIWDVMSLSCVASTVCVTLSASCMKCPGGVAATTLNAAKSKNLGGGAAVQVLLNGTFTNYNQIKGYQCPCASGTSWDSLRLRCYANGLQ